MRILVGDSPTVHGRVAVRGLFQELQWPTLILREHEATPLIRFLHLSGDCNNDRPEAADILLHAHIHIAGPCFLLLPPEAAQPH